MNAATARLLLIFGSTTVWFWAACMTAVWCGFFGYRPGTMLIGYSAAVLAYAVGMAIPGQFFRLLLALAKRLKLPVPHGPAPVASAKVTFEGHAGVFLGWSLVCAAALALITSLCVLGAAGLFDAISRRLILTPTMRDAMQWWLIFIAMLPWGTAAAVVNRARIRYSRRIMGSLRSNDPGDRRHCDAGGESWFSGCGLALLGVAAVLHFDFDPMLAALLCGAAQFIVGLAAASMTHPPEVIPEELPALVSRVGWATAVTVVFKTAMVAVIWTLELRCLCHLLGLDMSLWPALAAASLVIPAALTRRWNSMRFVRSAKVAAGAAVLAATALAFQYVLFLSVVAQPVEARLQAVLAVSGMLFPALGAVLVMLNSRHRFLSGGGLHHWQQLVLAGVALGLSVGAMGGLHVSSGTGAMAAILILMAISVLSGLLVSRRLKRQFAWMFLGGVLILSSGLSMAHGLREFRRSSGLMIRSGDRLFAWQRFNACGYLPSSDSSGILTSAVVAAVKDGHRFGTVGGNWLIVTPDASATGLDGSVFTHALPDLSVAALPAWSDRDCLDLDCLLGSEALRFTGIYYSPLSLDHPAAADLYGKRMLSRLSYSLSKHGLLLIHTRASRIHFAAANELLRNAASLNAEMKAAIYNDGRHIELVLLLAFADAEDLPDVSSIFATMPVRMVDGNELTAPGAVARALTPTTAPSSER